MFGHFIKCWSIYTSNAVRCSCTCILSIRSLGVVGCVFVLPYYECEHFKIFLVRAHWSCLLACVSCALHITLSHWFTLELHTVQRIYLEWKNIYYWNRWQLCSNTHECIHFQVSDPRQKDDILLLHSHLIAAYASTTLFASFFCLLRFFYYHPNIDFTNAA